MAELDHEVQMARSDLYKIAKYAIKLHDMLKGVSEAEGLEGWVQSKITKAADYMGSVFHNMDYDTKFAEKNKPMEIPLETRQEYHGSLSSRLSERLSAVVEYDDRILRMAKKQGAAAGSKAAQNLSMGGPGKWAKPFKKTIGNNDYEWTGIDPKTGMGTYKVHIFVKNAQGGYTEVISSTTMDKFGTVRGRDTDVAKQKDATDSNVMHHVSTAQADKMGKVTSTASDNASQQKVGPDTYLVKGDQRNKVTTRMSRGVVNRTENIEEDRCTDIAKRKYKVWPSEYASGAVVLCRKGKIWKKKK